MRNYSACALVVITVLVAAGCTTIHTDMARIRPELEKNKYEVIDSGQYPISYRTKTSVKELTVDLWDMESRPVVIIKRAKHIYTQEIEELPGSMKVEGLTLKRRR